MNPLSISIVFTILTCFGCVIQAAEAKITYPEAVRRTELGLEFLQKSYSSRTGLWRGTGWWNSANVLTAIIRYSKYTGDKSYYPVIETTFKNAPRRFPGFLNEYYDDEGWWALAWIEAFELTGKTKYLDEAEKIFDDMTDGWSDYLGGGIFWKKDSRYKNSIANNLFTLLALRLHAHRPETKVQGETYLAWAEEDWKWYSESGQINREIWMIEDGLRDNGQPNRNQHWTYNQGVAIAVMVEFYKLKNDKEYLDMAEKVADSTIQRLSKNGILRERNEPRTGADGSQFKGIFMRHLYTLYEVSKKPEYCDFIEKNSESIWKHRNPETNGFSVSWGETAEMLNAGTQSSALESLIALVGILK